METNLFTCRCKSVLSKKISVNLLDRFHVNSTKSLLVAHMEVDFLSIYKINTEIACFLVWASQRGQTCLILKLLLPSVFLGNTTVLMRWKNVLWIMMKESSSCDNETQQCAYFFFTVCFETSETCSDCRSRLVSDSATCERLDGQYVVCFLCWKLTWLTRNFYLFQVCFAGSKHEVTLVFICALQSERDIMF